MTQTSVKVFMSLIFHNGSVPSAEFHQISILCFRNLRGLCVKFLWFKLAYMFGQPIKMNAWIFIVCVWRFIEDLGRVFSAYFHLHDVFPVNFYRSALQNPQLPRHCLEIKKLVVVKQMNPIWTWSSTLYDCLKLHCLKYVTTSFDGLVDCWMHWVAFRLAVGCYEVPRWNLF